MIEPVRLFLEPGNPLPSVERPFGVLLDADDDEWVNEANLRKVSATLLEAGCRWIVCFGERSEDLHDRIDDYIVEQSALAGRADYEGVVTTFHAGESADDVAEFFLTCALLDMRGALILVQNRGKWEAALGRVAPRRPSPNTLDQKALTADMEE